MHKTQLYLEESQYFVLRDWAAKQKKSIAQLVRELIDAAIAPSVRKSDSLDDIIGIGDSGYTNIGANVDGYLYGDPATVRALERAGLVRDRAGRSRKVKRK
jgi:hypothetical protein